jgi:AcrR family transcriptional regulator
VTTSRDRAAPMDREQRRTQILGIAKAVFAEKGYHDARIDDIVVRAGVARGTFYLYFADKRAIFAHLVDAFLQRLVGAIRTIELDDPAVRPMEEFRDNLLRVVGVFAEDPSMAQVILSAAVGLDADFDRKLADFYEPVRALLESALEQGEAAGIVRPGNHRLRSYALLGAFKELLYQVVVRKVESDTDALVTSTLDLVTRGALTDR